MWFDLKKTLCATLGAAGLLGGLAGVANAQAAFTRPDTVVASGITVSSGSLGLLIDGDTSATGFYTNINPGVDYFEFGYDEAVSVTGLRIYNDYGGDDDGVERFDLEYLDENGQRIRYDAGFVIDNGPGTIDVPINVAQGVRAIRFFVIEAQANNTRCQIREIQFETQAFEPDADSDGINDDVDNCPNDANPGQADGDADGVGDACDVCPVDPENDGDGDGVCGDVDNCPVTHNPAQVDDNGDGYGDACVSPLATIDPGVTLLPHTIIGANAVIGANVEIGANVTIDGAVGAGTVIGDGSAVGTGCAIGNKVTIGANVGLGANCSVGTRAVLADGVSLGANGSVGSRGDVGANSNLGAGASLGIDGSLGDGSSLADGVTVGDNSHLGLNTNLMSGSSVAPNTIVGDNLTLGLNATIGSNVRMGSDASVANDAVIRSQASIGGNLTLGAGSELASGATVGSDCVIGEGVEMRGSLGNGATLEDNAFVGNQSSVGDNTTLRLNATLGQFVIVGSGGDIGEDCAIFSGAELGTDALVGARTTVLFRTSIGNGATIGADNIIDEQIDIGNMFTMGDNSRLWPFSEFSDRVSIGDGVLVRNNALIGDDVTLEDGVLLYPRTTIEEGTTIRQDVEIGVDDCRINGCGNVSIGGCLDVDADMDAFATVDGGCADGSAPERAGVGCLALLNDGVSVSGNYWVDVDGDGPLAAFETYCDMTTDGGGWTLIQRVQIEINQSGDVNVAALTAQNTDSSVGRDRIRAAARAGQREALISHTNSKYIIRYSDAEWSTWSPTGATNMTYDVKDSAGAWRNNACNGHYNNRGFSTYADNRGGSCPWPFSGGRRYMTSYHTYYGYSTVGGPFSVFVR